MMIAYVRLVDEGEVLVLNSEATEALLNKMEERGTGGDWFKYSKVVRGRKIDTYINMKMISSVVCKEANN